MRVKERKKTLQTNIKSNQIKSNKEIKRNENTKTFDINYCRTCVLDTNELNESCLLLCFLVFFSMNVFHSKVISFDKFAHCAIYEIRKKNHNGNSNDKQ